MEMHHVICLCVSNLMFVFNKCYCIFFKGCLLYDYHLTVSPETIMCSCNTLLYVNFCHLTCSCFFVTLQSNWWRHCVCVVSFFWLCGICVLVVYVCMTGSVSVCLSVRSRHWLTFLYSAFLSHTLKVCHLLTTMIKSSVSLLHCFSSVKLFTVLNCQCVV